MAIPERNSSVPARAAEILAQLGEELAFVESGKDTGLLPINSLVMDFEELPRESAPAVFAAGLAAVRALLDQLLDATGHFTEDSIRFLNHWHSWMSAVLTAWERGGEIPPVPANWNPSAPGAVTVPATAPDKAPNPIPNPNPASAPPSTNSQLLSTTPVADEPAIQLNLADDSELLREFHSESLELLQAIEQGVLRLEENPTDAGTINSIFRAFHTFKGSAGLLHLDALRDLAHDLESLLDAARRSELSITSDVINLILAGADTLKQFATGIGLQLGGVNPGEPIVVPTRSLRQRVKLALRGEPAPSTLNPQLSTSLALPLPRRADGPSSAAPEPLAPSPLAPQPPSTTASDQAPNPTHEPEKTTAECQALIKSRFMGSEREEQSSRSSNRNPASESPPAAALRGEPAPSTLNSQLSTGVGATAFVKLDTRKLDSLVDLVGELVITQSMVVQDPDVQRLSSRHLARCLRQLGRITSELQRTAMSLRMVPIGRMFQKMTRLVRDLATQQQKQVQLVVDGEETELDRNIVEELSDPLVHMIRNAVDHGIERPSERLASGKPASGTVRLSASHQRGGIVIEVRDDGKGLDRDRILAKARERGLVKPDATPSEAEIFALIFAPGFSTAEVVTDVSGRGVGMDVVQRNIEKLRGKVEIQSVPGQGTTFTIVLPLTLAIIDGMLVGIGDDRYIIPTLSVRESFRPRPGMVTTVHERGEVVSVRGKLTPVLRLGDHLGTPGRAVDPTEGIIVVVESGDAARGLLVDQLLGKQEVVIKNLGETFRRQELLAGAAILGDGRVGLILDVDTLVKCQRTTNGQRVQ